MCGATFFWRYLGRTLLLQLQQKMQSFMGVCNRQFLVSTTITGKRPSWAQADSKYSKYHSGMEIFLGFQQSSFFFFLAVMQDPTLRYTKKSQKLLGTFFYLLFSFYLRPSSFYHPKKHPHERHTLSRAACLCRSQSSGRCHGRTHS